MRTERKIISVFGSNTLVPDGELYAQGRLLGKLLVEAGFAVATGGYGGVMSAVSQGASEAGGHVIGVSCARIEQSRGARLNSWVSQEIKYDTLEERLLHLVKHNNGMIVLPGGIGTLSEFALGWSFLQVRELSPRPLVLLGDMWRALLRAMSNPEYVTPEHLSIVKVVDTPEEAVAYITDFEGS